MSANIVIEDGQVAARHVGDGDVVAVGDQLVEDPAHGDDVVVGVGREADDPLAPGQLGPAPDLGAQGIEDLAVQRPRRTVQRHQRRQPVLGVVMLGQLENGLAGLVREPGDRTDHQALGPLHRAEEPGSGLPGQCRGCRAVEVKRRVGVLLQKGGGNLVVHVALDRPPDDLGLVLAGGEDQDLAGLEDRLDPHRDRFARDVLFAEEIGRGVFARDQVEGHESGAALGAGARLVEPDVTGSPYAQQLEVDAARRPDRLLIPAALGFDRPASRRRGGCGRSPGECRAGRRGSPT